MSETPKKIKIAIVSFDWRNIFEDDFDQVWRKLTRDHLNPELNDFFFLSWAKTSYYRERGNIRSQHLKSFSGKRLFCDLFSGFILPFVLLRNRFYPDIILVYEFPLILSGLVPKFFWGSKIVLFLPNLPIDLAGTRRFSFLKKCYQRFWEFLGRLLVNLYICISEPTKKYLLDLGISSKKIQLVWPDTISGEKELIKETQKGSMRKGLGIGPDKKIVLSVGRLENEKGFDDLIRLFSEIKREDVCLVVAGEGHLRDDLIDLAINLGADDKIMFAGQISRERIWDFYRDADAFVLFSRSEGLGLVFWEAMYMGIPVFGRKIEAIQETIGQKEERGFLWDEGDGKEEFFKKLDLMLDNPDQKRIKQARDFVEQKIGFEETINELIK